LGHTITCCGVVIARLSIGQRRPALRIGRLIGGGIIGLMDTSVMGYGWIVVALWAVYGLRRLLGKSRRVVGWLPHGRRGRWRLMLVSSERCIVDRGAMSGDIMLYRRGTLSMHRAMAVCASIHALASCHASLALSLAVVKVGCIVVCIEAGDSLEWAVRVRRLGSIWVILSLRRLRWMIRE
jgi:hypothetical protein